MFMLHALRRSSHRASGTDLIEGPGSFSGVSLLPAVTDGLLSRTVDVRAIYRSNPWLYAVVELIARSYSRMPPKVYQPDSDGISVRASGRGAQLEQTLRRPGRGMSWQDLQRGTARDKLVRGNALWVVHSDSAGLVSGFERVPWQFVNVRDYSGERLYSDARAYADPGRRWTSDEVIHFGLGEGDYTCADSPIQSLSSTLALFDAVYTHLISYFGNSARPSAHFKVDPAASDTVLQQTAEYIREFFAGPAQAGRVLITSADWVQMSDAPDNAAVIDLAKQSREEICGVYGVAPPLVGILDRAIQSNVRELREMVTRDTVGPYVEGFDGAFNAQLFANNPLYRRYWRETETAAWLKADLEGSAATYPNQLRIMTVNELRRTKNLQPLDDPAADLPWYPNGASEPVDTPAHDDTADPAPQSKKARKRPSASQLSLPVGDDLEE